MGRYLNSLGYSPEEEERMRRQVCQVYDNNLARHNSQTQQMSPYQTTATTTGQNPNLYSNRQTYENNQAQTDIQQRIKDYEQKYNNTNPLWNGVKSMGAKDWLGVAGNVLQGAERKADAITLGMYSAGADKVGLNYTGRKNQYLQEAEQAGIGRWAHINEGLLDIANSNKGAAKVLSNILPSRNISRPTKILMDDAIGSGITNVNQSGNLENAEEKFQKGMEQSPYIRLMKYFIDNY